MHALRTLALVLVLATAAVAAPFTAWDRATNQAADIVVWHDPADGRGFDWAELTKPRLAANLPEYRLHKALLYLQESIRRMTGVEPTVRSANEATRGIVVVLLRHAPDDVRNDPQIRAALENDGRDAYNDREAFYLRSESDRLLVLANTVDGLLAAIPALLETVGYEVLGMGPNWTHVPAIGDRLVFDVARGERPSYYLRQLVATTGQQYGVGTLQVGPKLQLADPHDESVSVSYARWLVGARMYGRSMDSFPGHAMYQHHRRLREEMIRTGSTVGFLTPENHLGLDADRPAAGPTNDKHLWINTDAPKTPGHGKAFVSDGKTWIEQNPFGMNVNLDPTAPIARAVVLEALQQRATKYFADLDAKLDGDEEPLIFGTESEDGAGLAHIGEWVRPANRNWYVDYLKAEGIAYPQPYVLHGYRGIEQPREAWDIAAPGDTVFGFNNWLLREFDKWIDSLPPYQRTTKRGTSKKALVRCSLYSYAFHDVPPHINLDPRIRVMIAGYPKHRGLREWKRFPKQQDVAAAFRLMLPREPSGEYRIPSIAYYADHTLEGIPARWGAAPARLVADLRPTYDAGIRALTCETDFNFGKYGLAYYLMAKVMWNAELSADELDAIRNRWLERAYGTAWREMRAYYDFMLPENFSVNAPAAWAKAIRLIDAADAKLDPAREPAAQRRLDDLKQYWYFYYLVDTGALQAKSPELVEFLWKGQMSYMTAMHMVLHRAFGWNDARVTAHVPEEMTRGPAHYTPDETAAWWKRILGHWPTVDVAVFADAVLADGRPARDVDVNDLVQIAEFQPLAAGKPFHFNSAQAPPTHFVTTARAGSPIGFRFGWNSGPELRFYGPKDVPYGVEHWDREARQWTPVVDVTLTTVATHVVKNEMDGRERHVAEVEFAAPRDGTYRFEVGRGGFGVSLTSLGYDFTNGTYHRRPPFCFADRPSGLTQDPVYFYVPKGTRTLDLEVWDSHNKKQLQLYRGLSEKGPIKSRSIDIGRRGTHRIALEPGEDGNLAQIGGNGFAFPMLYSVPTYWAKCPAELLVPRAIAQADGWKIAE
jgi:hypothetical protein